MGNCCSSPTVRNSSMGAAPSALPSLPPSPTRKKTRAKSSLASFFTATPAGLQFTYDDGAAAAGPKRDLQTWEVLPQLGTDGVLDILHLLGSGGSGYTYLCRDVLSGELVAAKFISRPLCKSSIMLMLQEVELQTRLGDGHLGIVAAKELILTPTHLALVMEYAPGGNMAAAVAERWESALQRGGFFMTETDARFYFRQFVDAVAYMHQQQVAHRDLKLDNTLLMDWSDTPRIKLCDFGFAKKWTQEGGVMHSSIGTPVYMSPQLLAARYGKTGYNGAKADVWAAGVVLYVMLFGCFPFDHDSTKDANSEAAHQEVWLGQQKHNWRDVPSVKRISDGGLSREAEQLLDALFEIDEDKRPTIADVALHPWLTAPLTPDQEEAWGTMQQQQQKRQQELAKHGWAQARARQEAILAMIAVASQAGARKGANGHHGVSRSYKDLAVPRRFTSSKVPSLAAAAAAASSALKLRAEAAAADARASGGGAEAEEAAAAADRAAKEAEMLADVARQQHQPYLPHVAGKSDPSIRADLVGWGLEGQQQSILDVAVSPPPDFHRRVSNPALAYVGSAGGAAGDSAGMTAADIVEVDGVAVPEVLDQMVLSPVTEEGGATPISYSRQESTTGPSTGGPAAAAAAAAAAAGLSPSSSTNGRGGSGGGVAAEVTPHGNSSSGGATAAAPAAGDAATQPQEQQPPSVGSSAATSVNSADATVSVLPPGATPSAAPGGDPTDAAADPNSPTAAAAAALANLKLPDTVWRLPLTRTAPVSAFKIPYPEYQVAAGALAKQLHQLGVSSHRLRGPSRSSWPLAAGIRPNRTTV